MTIPIDRRRQASPWVFVALCAASVAAAGAMALGSHPLLGTLVVLAGLGSLLAFTRRWRADTAGCERELGDCQLRIREEVAARMEAESALTEVSAAGEVIRHQYEDANEQLRRVCQELEDATDRADRSEVAAEVASHSKYEFLAGFSHRARTLMTPIIGFAENLSDPVMTSDDRERALETIKRNGQELMTNLSSLLDIAYLETGRLEIRHAVCSPLQMVSEILSAAKCAASRKGLDLSVDFVGQVPETIQTDPARLAQILGKLVGNAIRYTQVGGVRLAVHFSDSGLEPVLQFEVIDTGVGMTEGQIAGLFDPFSNSAGPEAPQFGGTGLGLTICKRLASLLGGDLSVDSVPDQGTTFRLIIATGPLDGVEMTDGPTERIIAEDESELVEATVNMEEKPLDAHVLLAEDGIDNQRLISFILKKAGAEVTLADNGGKAVELALEAQRGGHPFDLILMDMQMPTMDGYTATTRLREQGYAEPIVALTAHAMAGDREKCLQVGCDDYVAKPIDRLTLLATLHKWRGQSSPRSRTAEVAPS
ncbi:MAG TPA: response regulator [Phycisphaerae bacterium]|nr:response regulator [Phycisphaerae bacterium]HRY69479.1 response regulator [Phycisphaerae bacterium]HSA29107.1 response regulator [Phycisphaerae bacterium]